MDSATATQNTGFRRARVLALHGYHGTAEVLLTQMAPLMAGLADVLEIVAIDAPSHRDGGFGWWHAVDVPADDGARIDDPGVEPARKLYQGWERTRTAIIDAFERLGPFDGVFGFSQGAALTALVAGMPEVAFRFAILVSGFSSHDPAPARLYAHAEGYERPSLHLIGRRDTVVVPPVSRALAARFRDPVIVEHDGGHVIPANEAARLRIRELAAT